MDRGIQDVQFIIKDYLKKIIVFGDIAVDATAGLGRDTLFLAQCVGVTGKVYAFDIQEHAIIATRELLRKFNMLSNVELLHESHSNILKYVPKGVKAIMFNLGYLPGSTSKIITTPESTIKALEGALEILAYNGVITIVVYRGHEGGLRESLALIDFVSKIPKKDFCVLQGNYLNQGETSPYWIIIQKTGRTTDESS